MEFTFKVITFPILLGFTLLLFSPTNSAAFVLGTNSPSKCGEILTSTYGIISYKPNETYVPNERCVWIIRVEKASSYNFTFSHMGYPMDDYNTQIVGFAMDAYHVYLPSLGTITNINGNVMVVTFTTSADPNPVYQGFTFTYTAITENTTIISPASIDYIRSDREGSISLPSNGESYTNNELNTVVLTPDFSHVPGTTIDLNFTKIELAGDNCTDRVSIFGFTTEYNPTGKWGTDGDYYQLICKDYGATTFGTFDMILMLFRTRSKNEAGGIEFTYSANIPSIEQDQI